MADTRTTRKKAADKKAPVFPGLNQLASVDDDETKNTKLKNNVDVPLLSFSE